MLKEIEDRLYEHCLQAKELRIVICKIYVYLLIEIKTIEGGQKGCPQKRTNIKKKYCE